MFFQNKGKYNIINPRAGILAILKSQVLSSSNNNMNLLEKQRKVAYVRY